MEVLHFPRVGEDMYCETLENGLHVFVFPKPGFQKGYAFFATNYGGMDTRFCLNGEWQETPAGVAHYLEHKTFDTKDGNALQELAANGASPNAFTSSAITGYYFESTTKFEENLRILLSFVSIPWYTQESVDKEQGIIGQEIGMIHDDPNWKVFMNMVRGLYDHHPIRESVAGTVESISHITAQTLYDCHKAFYDPANMVLCVAGDVDPEQICAIAREILPKEAGPIAEKDYGAPEAPVAASPLTEEHMAVSTTLFQAGFKGDDPGRGLDNIRLQLVASLALESLLGNSSPLYARLYKEGLINQNFIYDFECYPGCSFMLAGGESRDPAAVRDAIIQEAERISAEGIDPALWERLVKGVYGNRVRALNSFEQLCISQAQSFFAGGNYLDFAGLSADIRKEDAEELITRLVTKERSTLSVIRPSEGGAA